MTTLISRTVDGKIRCCDGSCHNAKGKKCRCICGGQNHGAGQEAAIYKTEAIDQAWLDEQHIERFKPKPVCILLKDLQMQLFELHGELETLASLGKD